MPSEVRTSSGSSNSVPQAPQAVAHGRLRQVELLRRLGHVALAQQRVEVDQQVEIDAVQIHGQGTPAFKTPVSR
jgi:hypothetical protein